MDLLDVARTASSGASMAMKNRKSSDLAAQRADAVQLGKGVNSQEELESKVRKVSEEFVSVFMNQITKSMRSTVMENEEFHGDNGEKFFQELLDTEYSKLMAKGSGYGLTDLIYESMMASYRVQQLPIAGSGEAIPNTDSLVREQQLLQDEEREVEVAAGATV